MIVLCNATTSQLQRPSFVSLSTHAHMPYEGVPVHKPFHHIAAAVVAIGTGDWDQGMHSVTPWHKGLNKGPLL